MDRPPTNSVFGLNHYIQDEQNANNLPTNSGFGLNHHIDHQELDTYINRTVNSNGLGATRLHIQELNTDNVTANSGFDHNHYVWEHNTYSLKVNSGVDLNHYVQEDNMEDKRAKIDLQNRFSQDEFFAMSIRSLNLNKNLKSATQRAHEKNVLQSPPASPKESIALFDLQFPTFPTRSIAPLMKRFTFSEVASATKNFQPKCVLEEGRFGRVYKGYLENGGKLEPIKLLDRKGFQGNREFLVEVLMLGLLHHQNLVNLIGYCADGDQRLLVYEYMPFGSLEKHLLDLEPDQKPLGWYTRMKIAAGVAKGLEYLHNNANPPVIHSDLKSSNILLDEGFNPKLSNFGLAHLDPAGEKTLLSSRVVGTFGYCAPEYALTGQLTMKSDIYSFGVVLQELITGRKAIDTKRPIIEQNLISWARPLFKDRNKFPQMVDPLLEGDFSIRSLNQALVVAAMCLQEEVTLRPLISDVAIALSFLAVAPADEGGSASLPVLSLSSSDKSSSKAR